MEPTSYVQTFNLCVSKLQKCKKNTVPISNTLGSTVPQESWGKSPKAFARVTRPFRPGGHESVKGLACETSVALSYSHFHYIQLAIEITSVASKHQF